MQVSARLGGMFSVSGNMKTRKMPFSELRGWWSVFLLKHGYVKALESEESSRLCVSRLGVLRAVLSDFWQDRRKRNSDVAEGLTYETSVLVGFIRWSNLA